MDEIERKFLIKKIPNSILTMMASMTYGGASEILQGYLPSDNNSERRVRKKGDQYFFTIKSKGDMVREETEKEISKSEFDALWPNTLGSQLEKVRYSVETGGHLIEIDFYRGRLEGLVVAEVEFKSERDANAFVPFDWFGREVTSDGRYKNKSLASNGLPVD